MDGLRNYSLKYSKLSNYFDYFLVNYIIKPTETLTLMAEVTQPSYLGKVRLQRKEGEEHPERY